MQFLRGGAHFRQRMSNYYSFPENEPHPWKPGKTRVVFFHRSYFFSWAVNFPLIRIIRNRQIE